MYCHGMGWHMHVLATNRALWDEIGHNVSKVTIVLASLKFRLSRAYIQGERALAVVSVAVALPKKAEASCRDSMIARPHHSVVTEISPMITAVLASWNSRSLSCGLMRLVTVTVVGNDEA